MNIKPHKCCGCISKFIRILCAITWKCDCIENNNPNFTGFIWVCRDTFAIKIKIGAKNNKVLIICWNWWVMTQWVSLLNLLSSFKNNLKESETSMYQLYTTSHWLEPDACCLYISYLHLLFHLMIYKYGLIICRLWLPERTLHVYSY